MHSQNRTILKVVTLLSLLIAGYFSLPYILKENKEATEPVELRAIPVALELPEYAIPEVKPLFSGGGTSSLSNAVKTEALQVIDQLGRPWIGVRAVPLVKSRSLKNTSFFIVVQPEKREKYLAGILAGSARNYDNFISLEQFSDHELRFLSETTSGGRSHSAKTKLENVAQAQPRLIEFQPQPNNRTSIFVNGQAAGNISSDVTANYFGGGYSGSSFRGKLGHISAYENLTENQISNIRSLLMHWWKLDQDGYKLYDMAYHRQPALLSSTQPTAKSGDLTVHIKSPTKETDIFLTTSGKKAPSIDELNNDLTVIQGETWLVETKNPATASFSIKPQLKAEFLGENGFYALLHRKKSHEPWKEIATTSPAKNNRANFSEITINSGYYALGVVQGLPVSYSKATLTLNGEKLGSTTTVNPGQLLQLSSTDHLAGQALTLTESNSGLIWYQGLASDFKLSSHALRSDLSLTASYSSAKGFLATEKSYKLDLNRDKPALYPGLIVKITKNLEAENITPEAHWCDRLPSLPHRRVYPHQHSQRCDEELGAPPRLLPQRLTYPQRFLRQRPDHF